MKKTILAAILALSPIISHSALAASSPQPLIVIATVKVSAGTQSSFRQAAAEILAATREEPGNISYSFNQSVQDPTEFSTVEVWASQAAIDFHMKTPVMQKFFQTVGPMFAPGYPVLKTYQSFER